MSEILVFYDGQCDFCKNSIFWVEKKLRIQAIDYHSAELEKFHLTLEQCSREVVVLSANKQYAGSDAAAFLLAKRGNTRLARVVRFFGPLSRITYRWIADHRRSIPVKFLSYLLRR
jgi:predicted DCC family thiol-disulfide oxidoreductase YuxK